MVTWLKIYVTFLTYLYEMLIDFRQFSILLHIFFSFDDAFFLFSKKFF